MIRSLRPLPVQRLQRLLSPLSPPMAAAISAKVIDGTTIAKSLHLCIVLGDNIDYTTPGHFVITLPRGSMRSSPNTPAFSRN
jgi:hypothetical protein